MSNSSMKLLCIFVLQAFSTAISNDNITYTTKDELSHSIIPKLDPTFKREQDKNTEVKLPNHPNVPQDYFDRLKQKGVTIIKNISTKLIEYTSTNKDITLLLNNVTRDYENILDKYYIFVNEQKSEDDFDKELFYLDMFEISSKLTFGEVKKLSNFIFDDLNENSAKNATKYFKQLIHEKKFKDKIEEIRYLCTAYNICRIYPAFSDHCANFIAEALKLPDRKFKKCINIIMKVIHEDETQKTLETVSDKNDTKLKKDNSTYNLAEVKELFVELKTFIINRFKIMYGGDDDLKNRTKATRILINNIDETVNRENGNLTKYIDKTVRDLKKSTGILRFNFGDFLLDITRELFTKTKDQIKEVPKKGIKSVVDSILADGKRHEFLKENMKKLPNGTLLFQLKKDEETAGSVFFNSPYAD